MYIILAGVISLIVTLIAGKLLIPALVKLKAGQSVTFEADEDDSHRSIARNVSLEE